MSIRVTPAELPAKLAEYGPGILVPTPERDFPRVHEVLVRPAGEGVLEVPGSMAGPALRRLPADDHMTLIFQPRDPRGWVLLVDTHGAAVAAPAADGDWFCDGDRVDVGKQTTLLRLTVASAMLHRAGELKPGTRRPAPR